jgi:hypothetical protein
MLRKAIDIKHSDTVAFLAVVMITLCFFAQVLHAATPLHTVTYSTDVTVVLEGITLNDEDVASDNLFGTVSVIDVGVLPSATDINAYHVLGNGDQMFSFDTTTSMLGLDAGPGDVVVYDGVNYTLTFKATANGLPASVITDALSVHESGEVILSFDTTVSLGGVKVEDEDLVVFDGSGFNVLFDGSAAGMSSALDLNSVHYLENGKMLLSFDGSGQVDSVVFDDEDVLEYDPVAGSWELAVDGSLEHPEWNAADLIALYAEIQTVEECIESIDTILTTLDTIDIGGNNPDRTRTSLESKLEGSKIKISQEKFCDAVGKLTQFRDKVSDLAIPNNKHISKISPDDAGILIDQANDAILCVRHLDLNCP